MPDRDLHADATELTERFDHPEITVEEIHDRLQELVGLGISVDGARENIINEYTEEYDTSFDRTCRDHDLHLIAREVAEDLPDGALSDEKIHDRLQKKVVDEGVPLEEARSDLVEEYNRLRQRRRRRTDE